MDSKYILDENDNPVLCECLSAWRKWYKITDRSVAKDTIGKSRISTVFLGVDHNYGEGPPVLYETMIFGGPHDNYCERYSTKEEALEGHKKAVELVRK